MQIGSKIDEIGGCARIACITILFFQISRFVEAPNSVKIDFIQKSAIISYPALTAVIKRGFSDHFLTARYSQVSFWQIHLCESLDIFHGDMT